MSDYLFAYPSFVSGVARAIDLFGVFSDFNLSPDAATADRLALLADEQALAADQRKALKELAEEYQRLSEELNVAQKAR